MVRHLLFIGWFLLMSPRMVHGQACPAGTEVVHVCQAGSKQGPSIHVDGSKARGFHGQCVCEVHAVGGPVVVKLSAPVVPSAQCGSLIFSNEIGFTAHCGNTVQTASGSITPEKKAYLTIATETDSANPDYCVKVEKESGEGQVKVACTEIQPADRANKETTEPPTTTSSGSDTTSSSGVDTTSSSGVDTTSSSGVDMTSSSGVDTTSNSEVDTTSNPGEATTTRSGGDTTSSSGGNTTSSSEADTTSSSGGDTTSSSGGDTTSSSGGDTTSSSGGETTTSSAGATTSSSGEETTSSSAGATTSSSGGNTTSSPGVDTTSSSGGNTTSSSIDATTSSSEGNTTSVSAVNTTSVPAVNTTTGSGGSGNGTSSNSTTSGNCSDASGSKANCTGNTSELTSPASSNSLESPIVLGILGGIIALLVILGAIVYLRDKARARKIAETARQNRIRHSYERM